MDGGEGGVVVMGRAEIDTRAPFQSVKDAVRLFGERVLVGEIYGKRLKEMRAEASAEDGQTPSRLRALTAELEETKLSLQKAREENSIIVCCMNSLTEELEQTKKELQRVRAREMLQKQALDPEIEDMKFIENAIQVEMKNQLEASPEEFQKNGCVNFGSPRSLARVMATKSEMLQRPSPAFKKTMNKRSVIPLLGWIFSKKKGSENAGLYR